MGVHPNSTQSLNEQKEQGKTETWRRRVFIAYAYSDKPRTDRTVCHALGAWDSNLIRLEITRLIKDGLLRECGKTKCLWTGKSVRLVEWTGKPYQERKTKRREYAV